MVLSRKPVTVYSVIGLLVLMVKDRQKHKKL